ncbi:TVP38/TMEM64 family protein [Cohnella kolymensis]|uniref:TVP38/TMEM64 family protein n=1 Tax=Cohnella kolymensis TaxID=1590652 RepID=UPI00137931A8|nr:VTT domain-containing protein [Cohnella kolymensis]
MDLFKKVGVIGIYTVAALLLWLNRSSLILWMESDTEWYRNILIVLLALVIAIVPALPYGIVAAVMGAKFGAFTGSLLNVTISVLAALILFMLVRRTFSEQQRTKAANVKGIRFLTKFTETNPFFTILFARLLPIVPAQAVNIYAAITRIAWKPYIIATAIGKVPFIIMVTLLGDRFLQNADFREVFIIVGLYAVFIGVVYVVYRFYVHRVRESRTQGES